MTRAAPMPPEQRRAAIIEASIPLLGEHGQALTTRMVAEAAGVAEGTIFRVFDSLDDLVAATISEALSAERLADRLAASDLDGDIETQTRTAIELIEQYLHSVHTMFVAAHGATKHSAPHAAQCARTELEARTTELDAWMTDHFEPYRSQITIPLDAFATLLRTFAVGHASRFVSSSLSLDDLARLALHGALRKDIA
ncbi:TetR/AcrR family transcriptional regulator [Tessaracoccus sp. MC1679]|uniref:TetR family transcriptional regulator n=1 Tax=Tessaracoccus sp. MC1679 TaxID=2760313 RepID=UPI001603CC5C|nr:TetR/AcrR family transcriptional regulator [Tessaracoccus sp. MC1679]